MNDEIPAGDYCYRLIPLRPDEEAPVMTDEFGRSQRVGPALRGAKRVLCPYWLETDHGTIRCQYLDVEAVIEWDYTVSLSLAIKHFGSADALEHVRVSATWLTDEIKICGVNTEPDNDDDNEQIVREDS